MLQSITLTGRPKDNPEALVGLSLNGNLLYATLPASHVYLKRG